MINDKELLAMIRDPKTQREGFAVLVSQYSEPLYWKVRHIVLDHDDADDVLQNAFVKAWTNLDSFQGKSSLSTWLYRIAINEALDFLRRKKQMVNVSPKTSRAWLHVFLPMTILMVTRFRQNCKRL